MTTPRRLILNIKYGETILFDEKDTAQAYAILSRAQVVSSGFRNDVTPTNAPIGISLIPASKVKPVKPEPPEEDDVIPPIPEPALAPAPEVGGPSDF